jgi:integrase
MRRSIERLRTRIETSETITEPDREALTRFSREMEFRRSTYSPSRHVKLLQHCVLLAGDSQKYDPGDLPEPSLSDALEDSEAAKDIVRWIHRHYPNEETNRDYRVALRMFGEHATGGEGKPPSIEQISASTPRNYDPQPDPARMLWWDEHIQPMLANARSSRDKAAIAVAWDLGARPGEFKALTVGDVTDSSHGMRLTVDGKTGRRSPLIIPSIPYLNRWLADHPAGENPTAPLWSKLATPERPSDQMLLKMIRRPARRAEITHTNVDYRRMRKSSASYLASQNVNQPHLEDHKGWKRGSEIAARYVAVFGEANDREIARAHGEDVSASEPEPIGPITCPRCDRDTPREREACIWCSQILDAKAAETVREQDDDLRQSIASESGERAQALADLGAILDEHPVLRDMVDD